MVIDSMYHHALSQIPFGINCTSRMKEIVVSSFVFERISVGVVNSGIEQSVNTDLLLVETIALFV